MKKKTYILQFKKFVKIIAILLIIATAILLFIFYRGFTTAKWGMSECLAWQSSSLANRFLISTNEQSAINSLISKFSNKISTGKISLLDGFTVLRCFYQGPVFMALLNSSVQSQQAIFEKSHNADYISFKNISTHFFSQVLSDKIAPDTFSRVKKLLIAKELRETKTSNGYTIPETIETFKKNISIVSFYKCLNIMKNATNKENISVPITLCPIIELKKTIENLSSH